MLIWKFLWEISCWNLFVRNILLTTHFEVLLHTFSVLFFSSSCALRPSLLCCRAVPFLLIPAPSLFSLPDGLIMRAGLVHLHWSAGLPNVFLLSFQPFSHIYHLYAWACESNHAFLYLLKDGMNLTDEIIWCLSTKSNVY